MKIAIIGTRGIPNNYGGFEQFAEFLSVGLVERGHSVYVYNSHNHNYKYSEWKGVHIIHKYDPEFMIGTAGQFIYDLNCIIDSRKRGFDVLLNLGYTSSSVWSRFFPKNAVLITNMDGLEWKRTKYSERVRKFLVYAEKLAVKRSDLLVADSKAIKWYLKEKYGVESHFIAYGATVFNEPDPKTLTNYQLEPYNYHLLIARIEPENNIETILDGYNMSAVKKNILVVGNQKNTFGQYLVNKYCDNKQIIFTGTIYDHKTINNLRHFSDLYFHGHSVGGTNPSLLESMACGCMIVAHNNEFNKAVLDNDALFFNSSDEVRAILGKTDENFRKTCIPNNYEKITSLYSWPLIINSYEKLMSLSLMGAEK